jgi:hypothetical protein
LKWGVTNEGEGVQAYERIKGVNVERTGFHLHGAGMLGCSPDGLVGTDIIIEGKCPFTLRDVKFEDALADRNCPLVRRESKLVLHKLAHQHQVQSSLYITGRELCHFVVWTPNWVKM